ncbi:hypothetical protein A7D00_7328 [Trichophyton violaceum]|uniref:tRNA-dihydrouridine(16/17) synthase [NAD(P)(+)] n=1 Tax=Trichophyton violaceum TaxID=34388 RepID=A0A178F8D7_TRIVO|nr:hypothetical protein A7D00_7328 [Trichophyton violaceum]
MSSTNANTVDPSVESGSTPPGIMQAVNEMRPKPSRKKLYGREFYESIGSPKMIVAPMVDRSEFAWRMLTRSLMGEGSPTPILAYSPMFHARFFNDAPAYRTQHFEPVRQTKSVGTGETTAEPYLDGNPKYDRPLIVQFCANDPDELLKAARHVEEYCDAVDLNLGCPQGIAKKGHYGAFLQEDPDLIYKLINKLHNELSIPVTAKFRILETKEKTLEYARMILSAGASILSVHGRRREQKGHNTGVANWEYIRYLRDNLPPETVIFANGNILNHSDISRCLEVTGADGVMSAEGNLSDPTIFSTPPASGEEGRMYWRGRDGRGGFRLDYVLRRYMDIIYKYVLEQDPPQRAPLYHPDDEPISESNGQMQTDEAVEDESEQPPRKKQKQGKRVKRTPSTNLSSMQGHLFQLLRHLVSHRTDIRDALARCHGGDMPNFEKVVKLVDHAVKQGMQEYEQNPDWKHVVPASKPGVVKSEESKATMEKYQRPWWVCQPYIRPLPEEALQIGSLQLKKKDKLAEEAQIIDTKADAVNGEQENRNGALIRSFEPANDKGDRNNITITPDPLASKLVIILEQRNTICRWATRVALVRARLHRNTPKFARNITITCRGSRIPASAKDTRPYNHQRCADREIADLTKATTVFKILDSQHPGLASISNPILWHTDLHLGNIFVSEQDPTQIVSIIDWQFISIGPLFSQVNWPEFLKPNDEYVYGVVQPQLPDDFETLDEAEKKLAILIRNDAIVTKSHELRSSLHCKDVYRSLNLPSVFLETFIRCGEASAEGTLGLRACLAELYKAWDSLGFTGECPLSFTDDEL